MKTKSIILSGGFVATLMLPACVPPSATTGSTDAGCTPSIVITQPANKDAVAPTVETLRESFNHTATASGGARVPNPKISILQADGKTLEVAAPKVESAGFGVATPKARQERMERQLKALEENLAAGCQGQAVPSKIVKASTVTVFKGKRYHVWAAGGGGTLWSAKEAAPALFTEDRVAFAQSLGDDAAKTGSFLIVTDSTGVVPAKVAPKKTVAATPKPVKPAGDKAVVAANDGKNVNEPIKVTPQSSPQRAGDNISINVTYPKEAEDGKPVAPETVSVQPMQQPLKPEFSAVKLPNGAVPLGKPVLFASSSAKLTEEGKEAIRMAVTDLKSADGTQMNHLFLVGSADASQGEQENKDLSIDRGNAVRVFLLTLGITVEHTYPIGENLCPDTGSATEKAKHRFVQMYVLRGGQAAGMSLSSAARQ